MTDHNGVVNTAIGWARRDGYERRYRCENGHVWSERGPSGWRRCCPECDAILHPPPAATVNQPKPARAPVVDFRDWQEAQMQEEDRRYDEYLRFIRGERT